MTDEPTEDTILDYPLREGWTLDDDGYQEDHYGDTFIDAGLTEPYTLRAYFSALVVAALEESHNWAKRPFGNSMWDLSLGMAIEVAGGVDRDEAAALLVAAARKLAEPPAAPAPDIAKTYTQRGFAVYGDDVVCTYGSHVSVHESSSAEADKVWLTIVQDPRILDPAVVPEVAQPGEATAHLDYDQAVAVRDRLQALINDHPQNDGY